MQQEVDAYLKSDRQWKRHVRITHAKSMIAGAKSPHDRDFWKLVLEALQ